MINDPAQLFYYLGLGGVSIPSETVQLVPETTHKYDIGYLVLEQVNDKDYIGGAPADFQFDVDNPPRFL